MGPFSGSSNNFMHLFLNSVGKCSLGELNITLATFTRLCTPVFNRGTFLLSFHCLDLRTIGLTLPTKKIKQGLINLPEKPFNLHFLLTSCYHGVFNNWIASESSKTTVSLGICERNKMFISLGIMTFNWTTGLYCENLKKGLLGQSRGTTFWVTPGYHPPMKFHMRMTI